ncbi:MAG: glycoside hydrolase family 16 protein [Treponema sp.]|nr:glycoside hydrolase family 16 protein [Treponema sp.]
MKKYKSLLLVTSAALLGVVMSSCCFIPPKEEKLDLSKMTLVWEDDFSDEKLNEEDWWYFEGVASKGDNADTIVSEALNTITGPIHNNEIQNYKKSCVTVGDATDSDSVNGRTLKITAKSTNGINWDSGKIQTSNKVDMKYGYIEARLKMPVAYDKNGNEIANNGVWPAFWIMPTNSEYGIWPRSGEIDIMEYSPSTSGDKAYATLHHALSQTNATDVYPSLGSTIINDGEYHTYGVMWTSGTLEAFYDGESLGTVYANPGYDNWAQWPYDQEFYVIINLAMGGNLGGSINKDMRKAVYEIDYVRYYK